MPELDSLPAKAALYIPHSGPMRVIEDLLAVPEDQGDARARLSAESPFVRPDGTLEEAVFIEMIAQTIAAANGYKFTPEERRHQGGFLIGVRALRVHDKARAGEDLHIHAVRTAQVGDFGVIEGEIHSGGRLIARGEIKVMQILDTRKQEIKP